MALKNMNEFYLIPIYMTVPHLALLSILQLAVAIEF